MIYQWTQKVNRLLGSDRTVESWIWLEEVPYWETMSFSTTSGTGRFLLLLCSAFCLPGPWFELLLKYPVCHEMKKPLYYMFPKVFAVSVENQASMNRILWDYHPNKFFPSSIFRHYYVRATIKMTKRSTHNLVSQPLNFRVSRRKF